MKSILTVLFATILLFAALSAVGKVEQIKTETVEILLEEALEGSPEAQYNLGMRYLEGKQQEMNIKEAINLFKMAAEKDYTPAQVALGKIYRMGEGVEKDYKQAFNLFQRAAEKGDAEAQFLLGVMLYAGEGVKQSFEEGVKWFTMSAEQGYWLAQENLGICYYEGTGVEANIPESYFWLSLASSLSPQKSDDLEKAMERVKAELSEDEIIKIDQKVKIWLDEHKNN